MNNRLILKDYNIHTGQIDCCYYGSEPLETRLVKSAKIYSFLQQTKGLKRGVNLLYK